MNSERWQQVEQLYQAALEHASSERAAFLAEACAGDEKLRHEVESLLSYEGQAEDFIESPALEVAAKMVAEGQGATVLTGQMINQYRIASRLGTGGMGEVYLADDMRLARRVALKFLPALFTQDKSHLHRFEQEARAVAALSHPNVCTIHEVIETEEGRHCLVMEYVDGATLCERMAEGRMNVAEAIDVAIQGASALAAAHAAGIVHRDIKPDNIVLRRDGYVKVLDFGLAKLTETEPAVLTEAATKMLHTSPGTVMGTFSYMSPEQARGLSVDTRTDVWSLGVVLYEMVAGQKPFQGETPTDVIISIAEHEPAPLSMSAPEVPARLEQIVDRALAKDREERYQTAEDLQTDLMSLKHELEIGAEVERYKQPKASDEPTPTPSRQHVITSRLFPFEWTQSRVLLAAIAGVLIVAGFLAVRFFRQASAPVPQTEIKSLAILPFKTLSAETENDYLEVGLADALITKLSNLKQLNVRPTSSILKYSAVESDVLVAGRDLKVDSVLDGRIQRSGERIRVTVQLLTIRDGKSVWAETFDEQLTDIFKVQDLISERVANALALKLTGEDRSVLTRRYTDNIEAYTAYLKGRYFWNKRTEAGLKESIDYYRRASELDSNFSLAYAGLADSYVLLGFYNYLRPQDTWPKAKVAATRALEIDPSLAEAQASLALVQDDFELDWRSAEEGYRRAIELNPSYATVRQWYAWHLLGTGHSDEALDQLRKAQELDPLSLSINTAMATFSCFTRDYDRAIELATKTLDWEPNFVRAHLTLGIAYEQKGLYDKAIEEFERARELSDSSTESLAALGHVYAVSGKRVEAQKVLEELMEASRKSYVPSYDAAVIHAGLANDGKALELIEQGYSDRSLWWGRLKLDPRLDRLRSNQRFQRLLAQIDHKK